MGSIISASTFLFNEVDSFVIGCTKRFMLALLKPIFINVTINVLL